MCVETTAGPIAMDSNTLSLVPPPTRSGTTETAAPRKCGRTSSTNPVKVHARLRFRAASTRLCGGARPMTVMRASGTCPTMRRPYLIHHELHSLAVSEPIHGSAKYDVTIAFGCAIREEFKIDPGWNHCRRLAAVVGDELVRVALRYRDDDIEASQRLRLRTHASWHAGSSTRASSAHSSPSSRDARRSQLRRCE